MQRSILEYLLKWAKSDSRKPLVLRGARQVGKTWLLLELGRTCFDNVAYVRIEDNANMEQLFSGSLNPQRLLRAISIGTGQPIHPDSTLVILDEIQAAPRALTALKYFYEEAPEYAVAVAGSLLGVALNAGVSFPVGKVTFIDVHPLSFREFLLAMGEDALEQSICDLDFDTLSVFSDRLEDLLSLYYLVGGMPEAVSDYCENNDVNRVRRIQQDILEAYQGDFAKHSGSLAERCRLVFNSIPRHLAKENKKFVYGVVKKGARGRDLDDALQFLVDAGLVTKVNRVSSPGSPLAAYTDESAFKLFCADVGLLGALADLDPKTILEKDTLFTYFKGVIAEQYVCQQLVSDCGLTPYYWSASKGTSEVDFLVQLDGQPVPIEVKSAENLKAKSLGVFCKAYDLNNAIRFSLADYREESWMTNVPLYAISCLPNLRRQVS